MSNCPLELWAPDHRSHINNTAFTLYAMECEDDLNTRQSKLNKVVKLLLQEADPYNFEAQCCIYDEVGIDSDTFTDEEVNWLERQLALGRRNRP